jgi:hypothetical protein
MEKSKSFTPDEVIPSIQHTQTNEFDPILIKKEDTTEEMPPKPKSFLARLAQIKNLFINQDSVLNILWNFTFFINLMVNTFYIPIYAVFRNRENSNVMDLITDIFDGQYLVNVLLNLAVRLSTNKGKHKKVWKAYFT